ncbi:MAG: manganese efflux pump [Methanomicrobia archaeon]|nr:manganese efflux pump [Methanomicrobia archaeon]
MSMITILLIAIGLAMDALAVSITSGLTINDLRLRNAATIALFFGSFQAVMPLLGWFGGVSARAVITDIDHWIAFGLLCLIGCKMIYESTRLDSDDKKMNPQDLHVLVLLAIATSIDALAVGISFAFLQMAIITPAIIIGVTTFALSFLGVYLGNVSGHFFEKKIEVLGGLILIGIGLKILIEHTVLM